MFQRVHVGPIPTRKYVRKVHEILMKLPRRLRATAHQVQLLKKPLPLPAPRHQPLEIVQSIQEQVEYPQCMIKKRSKKCEYKAGTYYTCGRQSRAHSVAALYLETDPLPQNLGSASRITLQMRSAEQNWKEIAVARDDEPEKPETYENSHSWFEVSILRRRRLCAEQRALGSFIPVTAYWRLKRCGWEMVEHKGKCTWLVHRNLTAVRDWNNYRVDWRADAPTNTQKKPCEEHHVGHGEGFLAALRPGDKIAILARAEGKGWEIKVAEVFLELSYEKRHLP